MSDSTPPRPGGTAVPGTRRLAIDQEGLRVPTSWRGTVDVVFDEQRVWSLPPVEDSAKKATRRLAWPKALRPYLDGFTRVTLREHVTGEVFAEEEVTFGSGDGPVSVTDRQGRPLAVTKWGRMNHPFEMAGPEALHAYLDQVDEVLAILRDDCGLPGFVSYGNLLGAARTGKLIGHDVDADLAYLSDYRHPVDVIRESFRVERAFRRRKWPVRRENGGFLALFPTQPDGTTRNIDVFTCFFVEDFFYQVHDVRAPLPRSAILPLGTIELEGREFPAPADPPALLEATYGTEWRTPDPAFKFKSPPATIRRIRGWLGGLRDHRDYWNGVHSDDEPSGDPSDFAAWVDRCEPANVSLVELGCGVGSDALWLARSGRAVLGVDYSAPGIRTARRGARRQAESAEFEVANLYDLRHVLTLGARLAAGDQPRVVYSRFLVEALEDGGRHNLWRLAEMVLRGSTDAGGRLYLEFRVPPGSGKSSESGEHIRRLLTPEKVADELRDRQAHVHHCDTVPTLDRAGARTDVCRMIVSWNVEAADS